MPMSDEEMNELVHAARAATARATDQLRQVALYIDDVSRVLLWRSGAAERFRAEADEIACGLRGTAANADEAAGRLHAITAYLY
ncbi:MAG: hypothetical protein QM607_10590 [Microbacterium sp.]